MPKRHPILEYLVCALVFLSALSFELYVHLGHSQFIGLGVFFGLFAVVSEIEIVGHEIVQALGHGDDEPGVLRRLAQKLST